MLPLIFVLAIRDCDSESEEMIIEGPTVIYPVKIVCLIFFNYQWIFLLCPFPLKQSYVRYVLHVKCMYHISDITDFALWPILLSSAIFWWVWGNPTKPLEIKLKTNWRVFLGCHISYVCMYDILSYFVYIFHLNCFPRCEYFHCVLPHSRSLISDCTSPQHKRTRKQWKNLNSWVERLCLGAISQN